MKLARQPPRLTALCAILVPSFAAVVLAQVPPMPDNVSSKLMIHVGTSPSPAVFVMDADARVSVFRRGDWKT
jgi:hypothetical protein